MRPLTLIRKVVSLMMFIVGRGGAVDAGTVADAVDDAEVAVVTGSVVEVEVGPAAAGSALASACVVVAVVVG